MGVNASVTQRKYTVMDIKGAKWPGSVTSRKRIVNWPGPIGRFAPGSEKARYREKMVAVTDTTVVSLIFHLADTTVVYRPQVGNRQDRRVNSA